MLTKQPGRSSRAFRFALPLAVAVAVAPIALVAATRGEEPAAQTSRLPERISDADFWKLVSDISEPGGYFRIVDNFTSNEREVGQIFTMLRERGMKGGVYMGVGPEQNLTYIAAIRPEMAFIVDIRRQAVIQHLMFKAIFELSKDRADFISLLFSKPRPPGLDSSTSIQAIWDAFWPVATSDTATLAANHARIAEHLMRTRGFALTDEEAQTLQYVYGAFYAFGPVISTRGMPGRGPGNGMTFADLTGYSYDASGQPRSFLSTEEDYRFVKGLHERNLIVPVSGDFGGPKAIRAIGAWLTERGGVVTAFYVSNVEQYLFQDRKDRAFYENVATLPLNDSSVFIRPYSLRRGAVVESLCPIAAFLVPARAGQVYSNSDALACVR